MYSAVAVGGGGECLIADLPGVQRLVKSGIATALASCCCGLTCPSKTGINNLIDSMSVGWSCAVDVPYMYSI